MKIVYILFYLFNLVTSKLIFVNDFGIVTNCSSVKAALNNGIAFYNAIMSSSSGDIVIILSNETLYYIPKNDSNSLENLHNIKIIIDGKIILHNDTSEWPKDNNGIYLNAFEIVDSNNITLTGNGIIDGQGYTWWKEFYKGKIIRQRPTIINIIDSYNVIIENLTLNNSPRFNIYADNVLFFTVRNMIIWVDILQQRKLTGKTPIFPFNTDGVDVKGKYVHIYNMTISNYDDSIAVKPSYDNNKYLDGENMNCSEHMLIEDINILYGVGLSIGSVPSSNNYCVQNITFQDIYAKNPLKFIYIKTEKGSKGISTINNIVYKNMTATEPVLWPIYIGPQQQKEPDGTGDGFWPNTNPNVNISNILIDNIYITGTKIQAGLIRCNISNPCKNITLNNVVIKGNYLKNPYFCDDNSIIGKYNNLTSPKPTKNCGFILV